MHAGWQFNDLNGRNATGIGRQTTTGNNVRFSAAKSYLWPVAAGRRNLDIWLHAQVNRVLVRSHSKRAYGVLVADGRTGRTVRVLARKEVIVCGGTVESPKLLLLSGIGDARHLRRHGIEPVVHLPGVGRNLQNHVGLLIPVSEPADKLYGINWAMVTEYLLSRRGPLGISSEFAVLGGIWTIECKLCLVYTHRSIVFGHVGRQIRHRSSGA